MTTTTNNATTDNKGNTMKIEYHTGLESYGLPAGLISETLQDDLLKLLHSFLFRIAPGLAVPDFDTFYTRALEQTSGSRTESYALLTDRVMRVHNNTRMRINKYMSPPARLSPHGKYEVERRKLLKRWWGWLNDGSPEFINVAYDNDMMQIIRDCEPTWLVEGKGETGTYPKRIGKRMLKLGWKLTPSQLEKVGTLIKEGISTACEYQCKFDRNFVTGQPGDYHHGSSCWWTSYGGSRFALYDAGGYGLRAYIDNPGSNGATNDRRVGRVWCQPVDDDVCLVFNSYGDITLLQWARMLATKWGLSYGQTYIDVCDSVIYVNGGYGVVIGPQDKIDVWVNDVYVPPWEEHPTTHCCSCGDYFADEDCIRCELNNRDYCQDCYDDNFTTCQCCRTVIECSDETDGMCETCYDETNPQCVECGDRFDVNDMTDDMCVVCHRETMTDECGLCHDRVPHDEIVNGCCQECAEDNDDGNYNPINADGTN